VSETPRERTIQQLYPLGALAGRWVSLSAVVIAPVYVVVTSWLTRDEINAPWFCLIALALVASASLTVVISSSPLMAPFTAKRATFAYVWANLAMVFDAIATHGTNTHLRDDYGPFVIGMTILAVAPYRPAKELFIVGSLSSILVGVVAMVEAPYLVTSAPVSGYIIAAITPVLILAFGAGTFVSALVTGIEGWRAQARSAVSAIGDGNADWIARSVQQDRVTILNQDVVPFFTTVLEESTITAETQARARAISDSIRSVMVADVDRSWLETLVDSIRPTADAAESVVFVIDDRRLAQRMSAEQRAGVRAFLVALFAHPAFTMDGFVIAVTGKGDRCRLVLTATLDLPENQVRSDLAPYFAVMRILFGDLNVELDQQSLTLMFSYDQ
jgi:hypothetical protein